jgi:hypothetical protein
VVILRRIAMMEQISVVIPLREYEGLKRRAERTDAEVEAAAVRQCTAFKYATNAGSKLDAGRIRELEAKLHQAEAYGAWAFTRIKQLETALLKARWLGSYSKWVLRSPDQQSVAAAKGETKAMLNAYYFF